MSRPAVSDASAARIDRMVEAGANAVLESAQASGLVEQGLVNIISIEAIRDRLGDRWPKRREDIWGYAGRTCQKHLGQTAIVRRLDETDMLVVGAGDAAMAQAGCLKALEETLNFFLGVAELPDTGCVRSRP
ncbi:MAG: hypothetical protein ACXW3D_08530 [Caulobacteraceae bacterium]